MDAIALARAWLQKDPDPETRAALLAALDAGDTQELQRAFAARLDFGTAGLRGILGPGPSRMNRVVVRETTQGLASYLLATLPEAARRGVVVGFDGRKNSRLFAEDAAAVLAARGIHVHRFTSETPTPLVAFAVRELAAAAGVMITASHNPPEYNGYKVYWDNGAQIIPPHDQGIAAAIDEAARAEVPLVELAEARRRGLVSELGEALLERYLTGVARLSVHAPEPSRRTLGIAYTPLHGVGAGMAEAALGRAGFASVHTVASQREPDGRFPTVRFPNPEEPGAMDAVLALAREHGAALACANDPDADRFAAAVRDAGGDYRMLTGNEVGVLLGWDLLRGADPSSLVVTTIVSSRLLAALARARGAAYAETLTGFKWIANAGLAHEAQGGRFLFGYEEALGYSIGGLVRDKDGISALVAFCELAASEAAAGRTVLDRLDDLYREHGVYVSAQKSLAVTPGAGGPSLGDRLRARPPERIAGRAVLASTDLRQGRRRERGGAEQRLKLPASDVLLYDLEGDARVIVRPSGTEPKIKCYYELCQPVGAGASVAAARHRATEALAALILAHQRELAAAG